MLTTNLATFTRKKFTESCILKYVGSIYMHNCAGEDNFSGPLIILLGHMFPLLKQWSYGIYMIG